MAPRIVNPSPNLPNPLAFDLFPTNGYAKYVWSNGEWGKIEWVPHNMINLPVGNVGMNYGASVFEGLKAFRGPDGQCRIFRPRDNAARLNHSADVVSMPSIDESLFLNAVNLAVARNLEFVPPHAPYGASGSMYIRPMMFASGANLILMPPNEFTFLVYVTPTGSLYGTAGTSAPAVDAYVLDTFDRAAPLGVGNAKLAGNYATVFKHAIAAKKAGFAITLHLDSATRTHIDEFSTSNFLAIKLNADGNASSPPILVVPTSPSILKSVTTKAIVAIAESYGWSIENRPIPFSEVIEGGFIEIAAAGTAAAIAPIRSITYHPQEDRESTKKILIGGGEVAGPRFLSILEKLTGVQSGTVKDEFDWCWPAEGVDVDAVKDL